MVGDVFVRFRLGVSFLSEEWAILLYGEPVDLTQWTVRAEAGTNPARVWTTDPGATGRLELGTANVDLGGDTPVTTGTVRLAHDRDHTADWSPFATNFDVILERPLDGGDAARHVVLSGFMRGDDRVTDDSPPGVLVPDDPAEVAP